MNRLSDRKRLLALVLTAISAVFVASPSTAQTAGTGTISGSVTDASAAIVPGASVVITATDTGVFAYGHYQQLRRIHLHLSAARPL